MDYEDQLTRALEESPEVATEERRFEVPPAEVRQEGNATIVENFQTIVDRLHRPGSHLLTYLQSELGTSAHIDESGQARLTGGFRQTQIADAVDDYTNRFVICPECGLPDTRLTTEQGADVVDCDVCGAISPVGE